MSRPNQRRFSFARLKNMMEGKNNRRRFRRGFVLRLETLEDRTLLASNILVSTTNQLREYTPGGTLLSTVPIPNSGEQSRDLFVDENGLVHIYNGTFDPQLTTYDPSTTNFTDITAPGWSTVNNLTYGGISTFGQYVFVTDMRTFGDGGLDELQGIVRFDLTDSSSERFSEAAEYIDLTIGLDGLLYGLRGDEDTVDKFDPSSLESLGRIDLARDNRSIAVNADGEIFGGSFDDNIYHFDSNGALINEVDPGLQSIADIDVASDGTVIAGTSSGLANAVIVTNEALDSVTTFDVGSFLFDATFVAFNEPQKRVLSVSPVLTQPLEKDSGTGNYTFRVSIAETLPVDLSFNWEVVGSGSNPASGDDFEFGGFPSGFNDKIPAGQTSVDITFGVAGDTTVELDEEFTLEISGVSSPLFFSRAGASTMIINDDSTTIEIDDVIMDEGDAGQTAFTFSVLLNDPVDTTFTVNYATSDSNAVAGDDYDAANGTLTFNGDAGETQTFAVLVNGDTTFEANEFFFAALSNLQVSGRNVAFVSPGLGTITNDDLGDRQLDGQLVFDLNNSGDKDASDPGLGGVVVELDFAGIDNNFATPGDNLFFDTTTDSNGKYTFMNLPEGFYRISFDDATLPAGFTPTFEPDATVDGVGAVTVGSVDLVDIDFGFVGARTIGELVWFDNNANGVKDTNELGLQDVVLDLLFAGVDGDFALIEDNFDLKATTDSTGGYSFTNLPEGDYRISVDQTTLLTGLSDTFDADGGDDSTSDITVGNSDRTDIDFGYRGPRSVSGQFFFDADNNGALDTTDRGLGNVDVTLTFAGADGDFGTAGDNQLFTGTTTNIGTFQFEGLLEGIYRLTFDSSDLPGGLTPLLEIDGNTDGTVTFDLATSDETGVDFGFVGSGCICYSVCFDVDGDGTE